MSDKLVVVNTYVMHFSRGWTKTYCNLAQLSKDEGFNRIKHVFVSKGLLSEITEDQKKTILVMRKQDFNSITANGGSFADVSSIIEILHDHKAPVCTLTEWLETHPDSISIGKNSLLMISDSDLPIPVTKVTG
ncbi:MAG: hypothetical protein GY793_12155 [Proteobacteria bacterium]|nr:hypothetical protein [Pseudomonadota bacterium]